MADKLRMTKDGVAQLKEDLKKAKAELKEIRKSKAESSDSNDGYKWCDGDIERQESIVMSRITSLEESLNKVEIIEASGDDETVDINNIVTVEINSASEVEICRLKLIATTLQNYYEEVSINSPLGQAILSKKIGDIVSFKVGDTKNIVKILKIE